ncbi:hypothetical protein [Actinoplanes subglobosus]|uniref:Uncharacterized protein n=1 Tax=Actinoplanes subglobosus TaxID=1547892 RepID=A0ABV8IXR9_9ACTN
MRVTVLSAVVLACGAVPASASASPAGRVTIDLVAGAGNHRNTASVTYKQVDGTANAFRILTVLANSSEPDCVGVEWNDPRSDDGWKSLISEMPCHGNTLLENPGTLIKAPEGHPIKVRLAGYHTPGLAHKDIARL